ncbi:MAG: prolyl oligopeptidase family serine peptidase [bacterium]
MTSINFRRASIALSMASLAVLALSACGQSDKKDQEMTPDTELEATDAKSSDKADQPDPFLWLEEIEGEKALAWVEKQNQRSLSELQSDPRYPELLQEALDILNSEDRIAGAALRGGYAYNFWQDETNVRGLWRRMPTSDYIAGGQNWELLIDFDALADAEDENWVYKGVDCLFPDYNRCMVTLSHGGSDASVRREFDVTRKAFVEDGFILPESKGGTAWLDEDTLLVGIDRGEGSMTDSGYPRQTRLWKRGTDIADAVILYEGTAEDVGIWPFSEKVGDHLTGFIIRSETFYDSEFFILNDQNDPVKLALPRKADIQGMANGKMILSINQDWDGFKSGSVIAYDLDQAQATLVFEPSERVAVNGVALSDNAIFLNLLDNIKGKVIRLDPSEDGWTNTQIDLPDSGVVQVSSVDSETGEALVYFENPTTPETLNYIDNGSTQPQALQSTPAFFDATDIVTQQFEAMSKDGTKIPYFVTAKKSVLDAGPAPTIQYGYGGFQVSILPNYSATTGKMWLSRGGVYVIANIRGGGEFGPKWHQAGLKHERQKIYDDFFAVSEDLIAKGITTPKQLGILGGSNGGLLMGVSMVQRPDLYNAIGIGVPLLDMLRYDKLLAGASWVGEYGDPDIAEDRAFLETISPYQNLKKDADYPRVYFFTSTKDDRVHPGHARKMAAKMEAYGHDFLYYENTEGGHAASANRNQTAKRLALQYTYFLRQLADQK